MPAQGASTRLWKHPCGGGRRMISSTRGELDLQGKLDAEDVCSLGLEELVSEVLPSKVDSKKAQGFGVAEPQPLSEVLAREQAGARAGKRTPIPPAEGEADDL